MAKIISSPAHSLSGGNIEVIPALHGGAGYDIESIGFFKDPSLVTGSFLICPDIAKDTTITDQDMSAFTLRVAGVREQFISEIMAIESPDVASRLYKVSALLGSIGCQDFALAQATARAFDEGLFVVQPLRNNQQRERLKDTQSFADLVERSTARETSFASYIDAIIEGDRNHLFEEKIRCEPGWLSSYFPGVFSKTRLILWWEIDRRTRAIERAHL